VSGVNARSVVGRGQDARAAGWKACPTISAGRAGTGLAGGFAVEEVSGLGALGETALGFVRGLGSSFSPRPLGLFLLFD